MGEVKNQMIESNGQVSSLLWKLVKEAANIAGLDSDEIPEVLRQSVNITRKARFEMYISLHFLKLLARKKTRKVNCRLLATIHPVVMICQVK